MTFTPGKMLGAPAGFSSTTPVDFYSEQCPTLNFPDGGYITLGAGYSGFTARTRAGTARKRTPSVALRNDLGRRFVSLLKTEALNEDLFAAATQLLTDWSDGRNLSQAAQRLGRIVGKLSLA